MSIPDTQLILSVQYNGFIGFIGMLTAYDLIQIDELDGGEVGNSGLYPQNIQFFSLVRRCVFTQFRSWSHKTHPAGKYLPELRKLIQLCAAENMADSGYAGIPKGCGTAADFVGIAYHRAELADSERLSVQPCPVGSVKYRESVIQGNSSGA